MQLEVASQRVEYNVCYFGYRNVKNLARIDHSYVKNIVARVHQLVAESGDGSLNEDKRESDLMALFLSENGSFFFGVTRFSCCNGNV